MAVPPLQSKLFGSVQPWRWEGHRIFVVEAGSGPLVFLIHGIYAGSSSYEFRKIFPMLALRYRVIAMDLLGCGLSAHPNIAYGPNLFARQIADAIGALGRPAAIIASSLGAAFTVRALASGEASTDALALICPTGLAGTLDRRRTQFQIALTNLVLTPGVGQLLFDGLASRPSLKWFLTNQAYADPDSATPEVIEYYWIATHQPGSRFVPAHFVGGALNCPIREDLPRIAAPLLVLWGERADGPSPVSTANEYVRLAQHGELATFPTARLLPHEEEPTAFLKRFERFIESRA